jgi:hypothetical protein
MDISQQAFTPQRLDDGIILQKLDDLCFVRVGEQSVDAVRTRQLGEKLIAFIEKTGCRKLVMSFGDTDSVYGFVIESPPLTVAGQRLRRDSMSSTPATIGSDLWVG